MSRILVVEDDPTARASLQLQLEREGFEVTATASGEQALELVADHEAEPPDLMLLDIRLPGISGVDVVRELQARKLLPPTVVISGEATVAEAVEAVQSGVHDFMEKPISGERLLHTVRSTLEHSALQRQVQRLSRELHANHRILGVSPAIERLRELVARVAASEMTVTICGASGTGKELVARAIHELGPRRDRPLVAVNCAALPAHLIESELFGHVRGAFTDARTDRPGLFEGADGGTLFLDEIGEMEPALQTRLLRVLEDGKVRRVGSSHDRTVSVRVLAATNRDLERAVSEGAFRKDLYYRLASLVIEVPRLSERTEDIPLLLDHFLGRACERHCCARPKIEETAMRLLESYSWPGNVRELRNVCERLAVLGDDPVGPEQLPSQLTSMAQSGPPAPGSPDSLAEVRRRAEREHIERVLERTGWNVTVAARILGVNRTHLHDKIVTLSIERPR
ncbi:MAG: sigma-54 dependent transcriptional regulator [Acidobacteria bacterium]|jgi:DNA-binding NtrC family response regulator|nr:sigma-54 dependent transcriptional regulator [Acidobacteriota bacterium]